MNYVTCINPRTNLNNNKISCAWVDRKFITESQIQFLIKKKDIDENEQHTPHWI